jgi:hypothetical protein
MLWPDQTDIATPQTDSTGALVMTETYWIFGVLQLFVGVIAFGFYWATHDLPANDWSLTVPGYVFAAFGIPKLFFRRRYKFYRGEKKVVVEGFSFSRGRFHEQFGYDQVACEVRLRSVIERFGNGKWYFVMFHFPDIDVAFFSSRDEAEASAALSRLRTAFALEGNGVPMPAVRRMPASDWMGRPCELPEPSRMEDPRRDLPTGR